MSETEDECLICRRPGRARSGRAAERRVEKRAFQPDLSLAASLQLIPTLVLSTITVPDNSSPSGVNQGRRGRRPPGAFYPLTHVTPRSTRRGPSGLGRVVRVGGSSGSFVGAPSGGVGPRQPVAVRPDPIAATARRGSPTAITPRVIRVEGKALTVLTRMAGVGRTR